MKTFQPLQKLKLFLQSFVKLENCNIQFKITKQMEIVWWNILWNARLCNVFFGNTWSCTIWFVLFFFFWRRNDEKKIFHHKANRWNICSTLSGVFFKGVEEFQKRKAKLLNKFLFYSEIFHSVRKLSRGNLICFLFVIFCLHNSWTTLHAF